VDADCRCALLLLVTAAHDSGKLLVFLAQHVVHSTAAKSWSVNDPAHCPLSRCCISRHIHSLSRRERSREKCHLCPSRPDFYFRQHPMRIALS
jgi:hypothetical protein